MIRWVRERQWLPEILLASAFFCVLGGLDVLTRGPVAFIPSLLASFSIAFIRRYTFVAPALIALAVVFQYVFGFELMFSSVSSLVAVFLQASFATIIWRQIVVIVSNLAGLANLWLIVLSIHSNQSMVWLLRPSLRSG